MAAEKNIAEKQTDRRYKRQGKKLQKNLTLTTAQSATIRICDTCASSLSIRLPGLPCSSSYGGSGPEEEGGNYYYY